MTENREQEMQALWESLLHGKDNGELLRESPILGDALMFLEWHLVSMLSCKYGFWQSESMDGIEQIIAKAHAPSGAYVFGVCWLLGKQAVTPIEVTLQLPSSSKQGLSIQSRVGVEDPETSGLLLLDWNKTRSSLWVHELAYNPDSKNWLYEVSQ